MSYFIAGCHALAIAEELAFAPASGGRCDGVRTLGVGLDLRISADVDAIYRYRLRWKGVLVLDGAVGDGHFGVDVFRPGPWLPQAGRLALAWRVGLEAASHRRMASRRVHRPGPGRKVPILRTPNSVRRAALVGLASAVVAHGERMEADPTVRLRWIAGQAVAVGHVGRVVLLSVHSEDGGELLTAAFDRPWPHHPLATRGCGTSTIVRRLVTAAGSGTSMDLAAFRAFCERAA